MIVWAIFVVWYTVRARWWKSVFGWNTILVALAIATSLGYLRFSPQAIPYYLWLPFTVLGIHRIILLEMVQREHIREPKMKMKDAVE